MRYENVCVHIVARNVCVHIVARNVCVHIAARNVCVHIVARNVCVHIVARNVCVYIVERNTGEYAASIQTQGQPKLCPKNRSHAHAGDGYLHLVAVFGPLAKDGWRMHPSLSHRRCRKSTWPACITHAHMMHSFVCSLACERLYNCPSACKTDVHVIHDGS
jgi:hypothetical protein